MSTRSKRSATSSGPGQEHSTPTKVAKMNGPAPTAAVTEGKMKKSACECGVDSPLIKDILQPTLVTKKGVYHARKLYSNVINFTCL